VDCVLCVPSKTNNHHQVRERLQRMVRERVAAKKEEGMRSWKNRLPFLLCLNLIFADDDSSKRLLGASGSFFS
jgi:hypothetical protein